METYERLKYKMPDEPFHQYHACDWDDRTRQPILGAHQDLPAVNCNEAEFAVHDQCHLKSELCCESRKRDEEIEMNMLVFDKEAN